MPDLLTHVLVGYVLGTLLAVSDERLGPESVPLVMLGALSPDFVKLKLVLPSETVQAVLGIPFSWTPLHTLGGSVLVVGLGALLVAPDHRRQTIALFALGAASHHALDVLLLTVTGYSYAVLWPLSGYHFPAPNLYLSSDRWPALVAGLAAALVWALARQRRGGPAESPPTD
ncbi:metal-dependent hydrolase [Halosolutus halophilus]|uniref:metal-dependent hydrolase n=1 Tax=Halosolutus halophilus TaxID=1552990 RepID=UPI0022351F9D|nr:metal-dependent hydrolase [Halosolutus halophilus]